MTYSFTAFADNAIKCSGTGFFKSGPAPPVSYNISDIISTTIFNPPTSTNSYTTNHNDALSVIQYLDGYVYKWSAYHDTTKIYGSDRRMHINGLSWGSGDSYQLKLEHTGTAQISSFLTGIFFMGSGQRAYHIGYANDSLAYGAMMLNQGSFSIRTNSGAVSTVTTNISQNFLPGKTYTFVIKRETNNDITVSVQQDSGTVYSITKTLASILKPAQSGTTWSDINGLFIDRYATGISYSADPRQIQAELQKL